ncbi:hypothetical protein KYZ27_004415 [Salmonella enterica]|nr:hypothetical protein [Salmonella enterica]EIL0605941.1 hypothetical protein [Salmonella enterica]ELP9051068.1 hypothetical protein [Salmonella enterica]
MNHIESEQLVSLQNEPDMFCSLRVTWLPFVAGAELPFFAQNDCPFLFPLGIPGAEDDKLLVVIDEGPALRPVPAGGPTALDKLFSVHAVSLCSLIKKHFIGKCSQE